MVGVICESDTGALRVPNNEELRYCWEGGGIGCGTELIDTPTSSMMSEEGEDSISDFLDSDFFLPFIPEGNVGLITVHSLI